MSRGGPGCLYLLSLGFGFKEVVAVDSLSLFHNDVRLIFNNKGAQKCFSVFYKPCVLKFSFYTICYIKEFFNSR